MHISFRYTPVVLYGVLALAAFVQLYGRYISTVPTTPQEALLFAGWGALLLTLITTWCLSGSVLFDAPCEDRTAYWSSDQVLAALIAAPLANMCMTAAVMLFTINSEEAVWVGAEIGMVLLAAGCVMAATMIASRLEQSTGHRPFRPARVLFFALYASLPAMLWFSAPVGSIAFVGTIGILALIFSVKVRFALACDAAKQSG